MGERRQFTAPILCGSEKGCLATSVREILIVARAKTSRRAVLAGDSGDALVYNLEMKNFSLETGNAAEKSWYTSHNRVFIRENGKSRNTHVLFQEDDVETQNRARVRKIK